jgi:hypothetical protein
MRALTEPRNSTRRPRDAGGHDGGRRDDAPVRPDTTPAGPPRLGARALVALLAASTGALCGAGCRSLPAHPVDRGLFEDVRAAVAEREALGWGTDTVSAPHAAAQVAESLCRAGPEARERVARFVDEELARAGGPEPRPLAPGADGHRVRLQRARATLAWWESSGEDCLGLYGPPDPAFRGVSGDHGRVVVLFELVNGLTGILRDGKLTVGPGLGLRLMPAYGISPRLTVGLGVDAGGYTEFRKDLADDSVLAGRFMLAVPLLLRFRDGGRIFDVEAGLSTRLDGIEPLLPPGFKVGVGFGTLSPRHGSVAGGLVFWGGYEYQPERPRFPAEHIFRVGTRILFDLDP